MYFDILITNMIEIADKIIFKIIYIKTDFYIFFHVFRVEVGQVVSKCVSKQRGT